VPHKKEEMVALCSQLSSLHTQDQKYLSKLTNIETRLKDLKAQKQSKNKIFTKI